MRSLFAYAPLFFTTAAAAEFDMSRSDNVVAYWGQDSYGASNPGAPAPQLQQPLAAYCDDDSVQTFPMAFLDIFVGTGGLPEIDLANTCGSNVPTFPGTGLLNCSFLASDIKTCQSKGKIVTMSLGGASGSYGFADDAAAKSFADTIWNTFLGGSSNQRPFGDAVLDGVDLDIEGGSPLSYAAFVTQLRSHFNGASKSYYVTGAPQCPFPDAYLGNALNNAHFDAVYVQFYNNYCGLQAFDSSSWNFGSWDTWAKTVSPNKNVKVYIGAPASSSAAGSGYVDAATLGQIAATTRAQYSSFGGVMFWDISQARANGRFDQAIRAALTNGTAPPPPSASSSTPAQPAPAPSSDPSSAPVNVAPDPSSTAAGNPSIPSDAPSAADACKSGGWNTSAIYVGGDTVTYNGAGYLAKWWTTGEIPGTTGEWGVWVELGKCSSKSKRMARSRAHLHRHLIRSH